MRKLVITFFVFVLLFSGISMNTYAADCTKNTPVDQAGDWLGTLGKQGMEKDKILAQRKANRVIACSKREAEKIGRDIKKKLGF